MSWIPYQTAIRIPTLLDSLPDFSKSIWKNTDNGLFLYFTSKYGWIMSNYFGMGLIVNNQTLQPNYEIFNGYPVYGGLIANTSVYYDINFGWVISNEAGSSCIEYWQSSNIFSTPFTGEYRGNSFWSGNSPPTSLGSSVDFQARGNLRGNVYDAFNGTPKTIQTYFEYWQSKAGLYGEYEPKGNATGNSKWFGNPQWKDQYNNVYIRSTEKTDGNYTYGDIYYSQTYLKWLIGTYNNVTGWWEGYEPIKNGSVIFTFKKPIGSNITGQDIYISFSEYVLGNDTTNIYLTDVSRYY